MSFSAGPQLASVASASSLLAPNDSSGSSDHSSTTNSRSSTVSPPSIGQSQPSQQVHPRPQQLQVQQTNPSHPYRNILTHQERKKLRMPKRKADAWPASILADPDVLSLDDEGRFVLCKVCHVHYAVHGGKKPKPVIMNSSFRTRAWDVHKERTNSHRMQKKHGHLYRNHDLSQQQQQQQHSGDDRDIDDEDKQKDEECKPSVALDTKQKTSQSQQGGPLKPSPPPSAQVSSNSSNVQPSSSNMEDRRTPQQQQQRFAPLSASATQAAMDHSPLGRPSSDFMSPPSLPQSPRRRVLRPNAPPLSSSHHQWGPSADSHDSHRRIHSSHTYMNAASVGPPPQASSSAMPAGGAHGKKPMSSTLEQRDGMMRWRNMHDDVSRALGGSISSKRPASDQYTNGDLRISNGNTMMFGETEEFGGNTEKVAKKLKSLDEEYDAKTLKRPDIHFDRRSASYKQYWGTLRDVYTASNHNNNSNKPLPSLRRNNSSNSQSQHHSNANASNNTNSNNVSNNSNASANSYLEAKDSADVGEATTPDDTGSSEDSTKTVVVHDQALVNAIDRLTGIVSKQIADRCGGESNSSATVVALTHLTTAVTELRVQQNHALGRIIELQEQRFQVMEAILQHKLRKEAVRNQGNGSNGTS